MSDELYVWWRCGECGFALAGTREELEDPAVEHMIRTGHANRTTTEIGYELEVPS